MGPLKETPKATRAKEKIRYGFGKTKKYNKYKLYLHRVRPIGFGWICVKDFKLPDRFHSMENQMPFEMGVKISALHTI